MGLLRRADAKTSDNRQVCGCRDPFIGGGDAVTSRTCRARNAGNRHIIDKAAGRSDNGWQAGGITCRCDKPDKIKPSFPRRNS